MAQAGYPKNELVCGEHRPSRSHTAAAMQSDEFHPDVKFFADMLQPFIRRRDMNGAFEELPNSLDLTGT